MNDVSVAESSDLEFEPQLPDEYFPIWRCIACGAMGNSNPCMGVCDYHKTSCGLWTTRSFSTQRP